MKQKNTPTQRKSRRCFVLALTAAAVVLVAALYWTSRYDRPVSPPKPAARVEPTPTPTVKPKVPPFYESVEAAGALPQTLSSDRFRNPLVARAYRLAGRIPAVLIQQPCYCWCDKLGHSSLLNCFVTDHGAG